MRDKGRVQNVNARLYDPGFRRQIGAGGQVADQAELGEQQRSRTLRANELARGIEGDTCQQVAIGGDLARLDAAADQHGVGFRGELKRSEEHTSELQSLMRISYAVFCLKKNKTQTH